MDKFLSLGPSPSIIVYFQTGEAAQRKKLKGFGVFCVFTLLRRECNLLTAVKGFKVDLEASRT